jgi:hypothetical protein
MIVSMHRICALALAAALLTACGSGTSGPKAPSKEQARAAANAINLTDADVPAGFTGTPADNADDGLSTDTEAEDQKLATCVGASTGGASQDVVDLDSSEYNAGKAPLIRSISSEVEVTKSLDTVKKDLKAYQSSKARTCLETVFTTLFKAEAGATSGVTYGKATVRTIPAPNGTDGGFGFTIEIPLKATGQTLPVEFSVVGFVVKHCEVTLTTLSVGSTFATSDRDAIVAKMVARAKASAV